MFLLKHVLIVTISVCIFQPGDGFNLSKQSGAGTAQNKTVETGAENKTSPASSASNSTVGVGLVELVPDHEYAIDLDLAEMMEMAQHLEMEQEMEKEMQFQPGMEFNKGFGHQVHEEGHHHVHVNIDVE